eukprot:1166531-Prorocentrum_lima.AAC.1
MWRVPAYASPLAFPQGQISDQNVAKQRLTVRGAMTHITASRPASLAALQRIVPPLASQQMQE